jgi:hypothetical protein
MGQPVLLGYGLGLKVKNKRQFLCFAGSKEGGAGLFIVPYGTGGCFWQRAHQEKL